MKVKEIIVLFAAIALTWGLLGVGETLAPRSGLDFQLRYQFITFGIVREA